MTKKATFKGKAQYGWYLAKHKANIVKPMLQMGLPLTQALGHDMSKLRPDEFVPYSQWFNEEGGLKGRRDPQLHTQWRAAVDRHYGRNMHHWRKRGLTWQETPLKYRLESVADWYSVGKSKKPHGTKFPSFKDWYIAREKGLPVDPVAKEEIAKQLGLTKASFVMEKTAMHLSPEHLKIIQEHIAKTMSKSKEIPMPAMTRTTPGFLAKAQSMIGRT